MLFSIDIEVEVGLLVGGSGDPGTSQGHRDHPGNLANAAATNAAGAFVVRGIRILAGCPLDIARRRRYSGIAAGRSSMRTMEPGL